MRSYIGLIHKDPKSDYGVSFPDLPGCVTAGSTLDEARTAAVEVLKFHVAGMREDGEVLPEPRSLEAIMADPENRDGVAILVPLEEDERKVVRINISLPADALVEIDRYATLRGFTRSGFLVSAVKAAMQADMASATSDEGRSNPLYRGLEPGRQVLREAATSRFSVPKARNAARSKKRK